MRVTPFDLEDQDLRDRIDTFMARFKIATLLNQAGIRKLRGIIKKSLFVRDYFREPL